MDSPLVLNPFSRRTHPLSSQIAALEGALANVTIERDALAGEVLRLQSRLGAAVVRRSDNKGSRGVVVGREWGGQGEGEREGGSEWGMLDDRPELWRQRTFQPHGPYGFVKYR